jgi:hypothetical protein
MLIKYLQQPLHGLELQPLDSPGSVTAKLPVVRENKIYYRLIHKKRDTRKYLAWRHWIENVYSALLAAFSGSGSGRGAASPSSGERQRFDTSSSRMNVISFGKRS